MVSFRNLVSAFSSGGGVATCCHSSVDSCPMVRENPVLFKSSFSSTNTLGGYFGNGQCNFDMMTWQQEGANQSPKQHGSRESVSIFAMHFMSSDLFQSQVFESVHLHRP